MTQTLQTTERPAIGVDTQGPRARSAVERADRTRARRVRLTMVVLPALATLTSSPGTYVADSRFEHYWASAQYFERHAWLWDPSRALGRTTPYFAPAVAGVLAALGTVLSAATTERTLHALYLIIAALGMVEVLRLFRPRVGLEHLLAGLAYVFSPFTAQFLLPSGLYLHAAIAPWLVVSLVRSSRGDDSPWRWPAVAALAVLVVGTLNTPSLVYAAMPLPLVACYLVLVDRRVRWRDVFGWGVRTGLLVAIGSAAAVLQLRGATPFIAENLRSTELPTTVSRTSSWAETWRGLGFWLSYFRTGIGGASRPEAAPYFDNAAVIVASYGVPIIAVATLWWSRWRARLLFGGLMVVGLLLMVGLNPVTRPSPAGSALDWAFEHVLVLRGLRSGYKAGPALLIGTSILFGVGVADAVRLLRARAAEAATIAAATLARCVPVGAVAIIAVGALPFWNGTLYSAKDTVTSIPGYWTSALAAVNALPDDGRVLILPGAERNRYRWGYLGDDMFDAFLSQPHLERQSFSQGEPEVGSLLTALDERTVNDHYQVGSFAPLARLLGIRWVLIRNDLDWRSMGAARPSQLDALRADPDLHRIATYGAPGQDVADRGDATARVLQEDDLTPVELYEIADPQPIVQTVPTGAPTLVSGDGDGLVPLASNGSLASMPGFRFTGSESPAELQAELAAGSSLVVTDSNRRRATQATSSHNLTSYTLPAGAQLDRQPVDLFAGAGTESVATYGAATTVTSSAFGSALDRYQDWLRPANAFDGNVDTAWRVAQGADAVGEWIRVDLTSPTSVSELDITPAAPEAKRHASNVTLAFSDGSSVPVALDGAAPKRVTFTPRTVTSMTLRIDAVSGSGTEGVGFSELALPGVDLAESVQLPDDVFRAADGDPQLASALSAAPTTYSFSRLQKLGSQDEELDVARRFRTVGNGRSFTLSGTVAVSGTTTETVLDSIVGQPVGAVGDDRSGDGIDSWGENAVDGDPTTAWRAPADSGHVLTTRFPELPVDHVDVVAWSGTSALAASVVTAVRVDTADGASGSCAPVPRGDGFNACTVALPLALRTGLQLTVTGVLDAKGPLGVLPIGIAEVHAAGPFGAAPVLQPDAPLASSCTAIASLDGLPIAAQLGGRLRDLMTGGAIAYTGCGSTTLDAGWHELRTLPTVRAAIGALQLSTVTATAAPAASAPRGTAAVLRSSPASATISVDSGSGTTVVLGQSFAPGWQASVDGGTFVAATSLNGMSSWAVPAGQHRLEVKYAPQRTYELGLALLAGAGALCLVLALRRPSLATVPAAATSWADDDPVAWRTPLGTAVVGIAVVLAGFLLANVEGAILAAAAVAAVRISGARFLGKAAMWGLIITAAATIAVRLPSGAPGIASFVDDRAAAGTLGRFAGVLVLVVIVIGVLDDRRAADRHRITTAPWSRRARAALVEGWTRRVVPVVAAGGAATIVAATAGTHAALAPIGVLSFGAAGTTAGLAGAEVVRRRRAADGDVAAGEPWGHLTQGSIWLVCGFLVQAVTGSAFWLVAARIDSANQVGVATALFASLQFVNYSTALGLQELVGRFTSLVPEEADRLLGWSVLLTGVSSTVGTLAYVALAGGAADGLSPAGWVGSRLLFVALSAGAAVALLVDARLMSARRWRWVFGRLVVVGLVRIPLLLVPSPIDPSLWLFIAIAAPIAVSGLVGLVVLHRDEGVRPLLRPRPSHAREATRFAAASWVANLAQSAPQFALPVIVLANVSSADNANFFLAWSIAAFALILPLTIGRVLLTEGSREESSLAEHVRTARRLAIALLGIAALAALAVRPLIPALYGTDYTTAGRLLPLMVLGGIPWAVSAVALAEARVRHDHVAAIAISTVLAGATVLCAFAWVPVHGVDGAVAAWLVGTAASALVAGALHIRTERRTLDA